MKKDTHPKYFKNAEIRCACGAKHKLGATYEKIDVDICSSCHPFYTGEEKLVDTAGRVEKFKARKARAKTTLRTKTEKKAIKKAKRAK
ncbi:MAG: 50S ribosomal protein L31 [bacterium]|nr:50S ribosomal protein L31 [bacterium]